MAAVKTAISLPAELSCRLDLLVRERGCSRSRIISEAVERYLYDLESVEFTRQMNAAVDLLTAEDLEEDREFGRAALLSLAQIQDAEGDTWESED
jgi:predicted DNA-binding protein